MNEESHGGVVSGWKRDASVLPEVRRMAHDDAAVMGTGVPLAIPGANRRAHRYGRGADVVRASANRIDRIDGPFSRSPTVPANHSSNGGLAQGPVST